MNTDLFIKKFQTEIADDFSKQDTFHLDDTDMQQAFLNFYKRELMYLKHEAHHFSKLHPEIAKNLNINENISDDPHIAQIIEAFAFLTARIHLKLEDEHSELAHSLLSVLCPHYLMSVPSMTIAQAMPGKEELFDLIKIPPQTRFVISDLRQANYYFTTVYPLEVWPIHIVHTSLSDSCLSLKLKSSLPFQTLCEKGFSSLRFYLDYHKLHSDLIYLLLFQQLKKIEIHAHDSSYNLSSRHFQPVGYSEDETLLPYNANLESSLCLLTEYFIFPEKFYFFDIKNLHPYLHAFSHNEIKLVFHWNQPRAHFKNGQDANYLKLHCTPLINLFQTRLDPIKYDPTQHTHVLRIDPTQEIEKMQQVNLTRGNKEIACSPFYYHDDTHASIFYHLQKNAFSSSDYSLSFSGFDETSDSLDLPLIHSTAYCSNKNTDALHLEKTELIFLQAQQKTELIKHLISVSPLTEKKKWIQRTADYWQILSLFHLKLNFISQNKNEMTTQFKKLFSLHLRIRPELQTTLLNHIESLQCQTKLMRRPSSPESLTQGFEFTLVVDETFSQTQHAPLFVSFLSHFFKHHVPINSFAQLRVITRTGKVLFSANDVGDYPQFNWISSE